MTLQITIHGRRYDLENAAERDEGALADACRPYAMLRSFAATNPAHEHSLVSSSCMLPISPWCQRLSTCSGRAEKIGKLAKQFGKWHGISSLINLGILVVAVGHGYWLAGETWLAECGCKLSTSLRRLLAAPPRM